jgi:hypothetical protein
MFILPYHSSSRPFQFIHITTFHCLTLGGALLWKEDDSLDVIRDIIEPNGIYLSSPPVKVNDIVFCEVDTTRTNLADQYQWEEISLTDRQTFCWRTYYLMGKGMDMGKDMGKGTDMGKDMGKGTNTTDWLPLPAEERLEPYSLQEVIHSFSQVQRVDI